MIKSKFAKVISKVKAPFRGLSEFCRRKREVDVQYNEAVSILEENARSCHRELDRREERLRNLRESIDVTVDETPAARPMSICDDKAAELIAEVERALEDCGRG